MEVVEFLGLPGAGKSTMRREVIASMKEAGQSAADLPTAMLAAIRLHGADRLTRAVAIVTRSGSSPVWRRAYARSTDRFTALTRFLAANPEVMEVVLATQRQRRGRDLHQERVLSWILSLMANTQLVDKTAVVGCKQLTSQTRAIVKRSITEEQPALRASVIRFDLLRILNTANNPNKND